MVNYHDTSWKPWYNMVFSKSKTMVKYHGVLKQVNYGIPYNYHTQYMNNHGISWYNMVYHVIPCYIFIRVFSTNLPSVCNALTMLCISHSCSQSREMPVETQHDWLSAFHPCLGKHDSICLQLTTQ